MNSTACEFSTGIVPYMYGELPVSERSAFESHLLECGDCTDEFAEISASRFEVYEWKKLEFDPLPTPRFVIPYGENASQPAWIEKVRAVFANGWAAPTAAFAGLALVVAIVAGYYASSSNNGAIVADVESPVQVTPQASDVPEPQPQEASITEPEPRRVVRAAVSEPTRPKTRNAVRRTAPRSGTDIKVESARNQRTPTPMLNDFAEDEDTSLRLAELFDDIGSSE